MDNFIIPFVDPQDVDQEMELLRLQGINPKRSLVEMKMRSREQVFDEIPDFVSVQPVFESSSVEIEVIEKLVEWALDQTDPVQTIIFDFLDDPDEDSLEETLLKLSEEGVTLSDVHSPKTRTLTDFIIDNLKKGPLSKDQIYDLVRSAYTSKRPEAAARTILRKLIRQEKIIFDESLYCIA